MVVEDADVCPLPFKLTQ